MMPNSVTLARIIEYMHDVAVLSLLWASRITRKLPLSDRTHVRHWICSQKPYLESSRLPDEALPGGRLPRLETNL